MGKCCPSFFNLRISAMQPNANHNQRRAIKAD